MSRIGKMPIQIPDQTTCEVVDNLVVVKGPKGTVELPLIKNISVEKRGNEIIIAAKDVVGLSSQQGLFRTLVQNAIIGVTKGWEKELELVGVGYKVLGSDREITLNVGFTHPVKITAPAGISFKITDNTKITVTGVDKKEVGEITSQIRRIKPPEPYKGKGIRYKGEIVRKKAGKAVKAAGTPA